jgi:hypothetical protein
MTALVVLQDKRSNALSITSQQIMETASKYLSAIDEDLMVKREA